MVGAVVLEVGWNVDGREEGETERSPSSVPLPPNHSAEAGSSLLEIC